MLAQGGSSPWAFSCPHPNPQTPQHIPSPLTMSWRRVPDRLAGLQFRHSPQCLADDLLLVKMLAEHGISQSIQLMPVQPRDTAPAPFEVQLHP